MLEMTKNIYNGNQTSGLGGCRSNHNASGNGGKSNMKSSSYSVSAHLGGGGGGGAGGWNKHDDCKATKYVRQDRIK